MHITVDIQIPLFLFLHHLEEVLCMIYLWVVILVRGDPLSVQVNARHRVPIIPTYHSIRIQYWKQQECIKFPQKLGLTSIRGNEIVETLECLAARSLPRMDSSGYRNNRLLFISLGIPTHCDTVHWQSADTPAQLLPLIVEAFLLIFYHNTTLLVGWLTLNGGLNTLLLLNKHADNIAVCSRHCKSKIDCIIIVLEFKLELQSIIVICFLLLL